MPTTKKKKAAFQKLLDHLFDYMDTVRYDWATYHTLFVDQGSIKILERIGSNLFVNLRFQLRERIILFLARLFDSPNAKQENFTLYFLLEQLREVADETLVAEVEEAIQAARVQAEPILQERHKYIAHRDKEVALSRRIHGDVSYEQIDALLSNVEVILDRIYAGVYGGTYFHHVFADAGRNQTRFFINKLAVIAAMDEGELAVRMAELNLDNEYHHTEHPKPPALESD